MPALLSSPFRTEDHLRLQQQVTTFTDTRIAPLAAEVEARGPHTDDEMRRVLAETGWLGVLIGTEWGGLGLGHVAKTLILQAISRVSPASGAILQASILGAAPIAEYGSAEMRRTWLSQLGALLASGGFRVLKAKMDPRRSNGGTFLGLDGIAVN